jgi:hypothetical protein
MQMLCELYILNNANTLLLQNIGLAEYYYPVALSAKVNCIQQCQLSHASKIYLPKNAHISR